MNKNKNAERQRAAKMAEGARRLRAVAMALAMGFSVNLSVGMAVAQQDPTTIGAGQKPMVIILMDTSASMEYTVKGEGHYPERTPTPLAANGSPLCNEQGASNSSNLDANLNSWCEPYKLNEGLHLKNDRLMPGNHSPTSKGPQLVGPCYVWEPVCDKYERPSWYPNAELMPRNNSGPMRDRLDSMRGLLPATELLGIITLGTATNLVRFKDASQPRHVQLKEILTGDMILSPRVGLGANQSLPSEQLFALLNPQDHGPGCWFVPRMSGARQGADTFNLCDDLDGSNNFTNSPDGQSFNAFVDHIDPRPHFQEVHDRQLPTGLMDNLAGTVIFAVAMFDGFSGEYQPPNGMSPGRVDPTSHQTNDGMDHVDLDVLSGPFNHSSPTRLRDDGMSELLKAEADNRYNLGVYKVIGPALLDIGARPTLLPSLSRMTQLALVDAGYLRNGDKKEWEVKAKDDKNEINYTLPRELEDYVVPFQMGHQPIAAATPLAAAMRDIHKFFIGGQKAFQKDGKVSPAANKVYDPYRDNTVKVKDVDSPNVIHSPITTDPYQYCRAKHVVMMTDGFPQPEWGSGLGSDRLNDVYGYKDKDALYPYGTAETEIAALVNDQRINPSMINGQIVDPKFQSRVHVVGLNVGEATTQAASCAATDTSLNCQVRRKLGLMARAGNTCAYYYLCDPGAGGLCEGDGKKYIPSSGPWPAKGTCDPATDNCLVLQLEGNEFMFNPPNGSPTFACPAPALLLQKNDRPASTPMGQVATVRDDLTQALQFVLNEVIDASGGVASRTRTSVANTLDQFAGGLPKTGQYRFYSGVDVGGGVYWKGILNRQELICEGAAGANTTPSDALTMDLTKAPRPIHEDIAAQVKAEPSGKLVDNRRVFSVKPLLGMDGKLVPPASTEDDLYPISFELVRLSADKDEFRPPNTDPTLTQPGRLRGSRLPFRVEALVGAQDPAVLSLLTNVLNAINLGGIPLLGGAFDAVRNVLQLVFGTTDIEEVTKIVNSARGTTSEKRGRTLNAILNSNPVTVGPPDLDIPIDSYRAFRARYANRPTMLYVSTLDGQLHAIHAGEMNGTEQRVLVRNFVDVLGDSQGAETGVADAVIPGTTNKNFDKVPMDQKSQREAWAYIPHMLVRKIGQSNNRQPNLMDGTPVVADVRLCDGRANLNQSVQACRAFRDSGTLNPEDQWRTVLVQGLGAAGAGYFAIDITRAGGPTSASGDVVSPDPIPLWEFNVGWEAEQIAKLKAAGKQFCYAPEGSVALPGDPDNNNMPVSDSNCTTKFNTRAFDEYAFLGLSASEPAIGTVALHSTTINASVQRPIAVFSGGIKGDIPEHDTCVLNARMGRAFYVVDMQTGSLLRRFVSYRNKAGNEVRFDGEVSGAPALFDTTPGTVTSRGYVGDSKGRLFRINFNVDKNGDSRMTPEDWTLDLMFDPNDSVQGAVLRSQVLTSVPSLVNGADAINFGPASFRPAVALDANRQIIVVYGLGERGETSAAGQAQAVVALRESFDSMGKLRVDADSVLWTHSFGEAEKLTGEPIVFNNGVYFTSFKENPANRCEPGKSRIWGVDFLGAVSSSGTPLKRIRGVMPLVLPDGTDLRTLAAGTGEDGVLYQEDNDNTGNAFWVGPAAPTLIRGVTITLGPVCSVSLDPTNQQSFDGSQDPQPQLIAQTGGATPGNAAFGGRKDPVAGGINRIVIPLRRPRTQTVPLSWANLGI